MTYLDVGLCNCAACGVELIGERTAAKLVRIPEARRPWVAIRRRPVAGRILGRPYCETCLATAPDRFLHHRETPAPVVRSL